MLVTPRQAVIICAGKPGQHEMRQATDDWQQAFERLAVAQRPATLTLLSAAVDDDATHARLLNTLSLLEHIGSVRIMAVQSGQRIEQATLKHLMEEARHAWFLRRQAERLAGRALDYSDPELLAGASARQYFRRLDACVRRQTRPAAIALAYPLVSLLIEFRATWFYALYQRVLDAAGLPLSLKKLSGEEAVHLREMTARVARLAGPAMPAMDGLLAQEAWLYRRLLSGWQSGLAGPAAAAA